MEYIKSRFPDLYEEISRDIRDKDYLEISSDIAKLNFLSLTSPIQTFNNYMELCDLLGVSLLTSPSKFSVLESSSLSYSINSFFFRLSCKSQIKEICSSANECLISSNFFKAAREQLSKNHTDIESVVVRVNEIYHKILNLMMVAMMHLSKKFESMNKKDYLSYANHLFYNDVLMNVQFTYKNSAVIRDVISHYSGKPNYHSVTPMNVLNFYFGETENGKRSGFGRVSFENGDKYEGEWANDLMNGFGLYVFKANGWYKGSFVNGEISGKGFRKFLDGASYEGEFVKGKRMGKGKMVFKNQDVYEGNWHYDGINGEGKYYWKKTGDVYEGKFRYDSRASGVLQLPNGEKFLISN